MDNKKPEHMTDEVWLQYLQWMELTGRPLHGNYAEHLARARADADRNKALLQAHYRALHDAEPSHSGTP